MSNIKICFTDFDGCLNSTSFYMNRTPVDDRPYPLSEIDPIAVEYLNQICSQTGAKVVVSSTWRHGRTVAELQNILEQCGFTGQIISVTPSLDKFGDWVERGNEIWKWIMDNKELLGYEIYFDYKDYVVLDDDLDMLYRMKDNFIHIDSAVGITPETVLKAIEILKAK